MNENDSIRRFSRGTMLRRWFDLRSWAGLNAFLCLLPLCAAQEAESLEKPGDDKQIPPPEVRIEWLRVHTSANRDLEKGAVQRSAQLSGRFFFTEHEPGQLLAFQSTGVITEMDPDVRGVAIPPLPHGPAFWQEPLHLRAPRMMRDHGEHVSVQLPSENLPVQLKLLRGRLEMLVARKMTRHEVAIEEIREPIQIGPDLRISFEQFELQPNGLQFKGEVWSRNGPFPLRGHPAPDQKAVKPDEWRGPFPHLAWLVSESGERHPVPLAPHGARFAGQAEAAPQGLQRDLIGSTMTWSPNRTLKKIEFQVIHEVAIHQVAWELEDLVIPFFVPGGELF